jgi:hypothetical protein
MPHRPKALSLQNGVASLTPSRSKNGVASLAPSRSKNGVASLAYVPGIHVLAAFATLKDSAAVEVVFTPGFAVAASPGHDEHDQNDGSDHAPDDKLFGFEVGQTMHSAPLQGQARYH